MALAREAREQRDLSRLNDEEYNRISQYGYERHTNLFLSDHDEYHCIGRTVKMTFKTLAGEMLTGC